MKIFKRLPYIALFCLLLAAPGCSKTYSSDYLKEYGAFFDYSLGEGNWELAATGKGENAYADFAYYYTWWEISYTDIDGEERILYFDNYSDHAIASDVLRAARHAAGQKIAKARFGYGEFFVPEEALGFPGKMGPESYNPDSAEPGLILEVGHTKDSNYDYSQITSTENGLRLYDFDVVSFIRDYRHVIAIKGRFEDEQLYREAVAEIYGNITDLLGYEAHILVDVSLYEPGSGEALERFNQIWKDGERQYPD